MHEFMDEKNHKGLRRRIPIKDYAVTKNDAMAEFVNHVGYEDIFELTQQMIDCEADIIVTDRRSEVARNAEKLGRIMQAIPLIGNFAQLFPDVLARINGEGIIEQLLESVGMDIDRSLMDDESIYNDEFENLTEEILLGHNVSLPEGESREDSMKRLRFLLALKKKEVFKGLAKRAYEFHLGKTMDNIVADHSMDVASKRGKKVTPEGVPTPPMGVNAGAAGFSNLPNMSGPSQAGGPQPGAKQSGKMNIPQPDERLMKGNSPEALA
jgi:hypothetical protein